MVIAATRLLHKGNTEKKLVDVLVTQTLPTYLFSCIRAMSIV